jgi:hypothetical protein
MHYYIIQYVIDHPLNDKSQDPFELHKTTGQVVSGLNPSCGESPRITDQLLYPCAGAIAALDIPPRIFRDRRDILRIAMVSAHDDEARHRRR